MILHYYMKYIKINATKTNLRKVIKWSRSRFCPLRKEEVISEILKAIQEKENKTLKFETGTYTEQTGGYGICYEFSKRNGENYLIIRTPHGKKPIQKFQLIEGKRGKYPLNQKPNYHVFPYEKKQQESQPRSLHIDSFSIGDFLFHDIKRFHNEGKKKDFRYLGKKKFHGKSSSFVDPSLVKKGYYQERGFNINARNLSDLKRKLKEEFC